MADGKVVNVSQTNHPGLSRALKGGTSNYGIAIHFRMNTLPGGDFWGGQVFYNMSTAITLQPLPQILTSKGAKNGGNVLGFTREDGNVVNAILTTYWNDAADDDRVHGESQRLIQEAQKMAKKAKVNIRALYLNYAAKWQDPIGGYGEDEVQFLKEMSTKYDPNGVFQNGIPGGYKVSGKNGSG
ncbi:hypothetical protein TI39_contig327g00015 [Zymoseptoria brevis]|uniref:Berberine/berberine-like domain-containing protein n=1 Tax=Zymoseptoria brevis TaxID=1047168 RepID=A0A0F4GTY4_9PEZI|nr:hypothetical protein TI39_contig327g00015 [Zymoseptoria brevis]